MSVPWCPWSGLHHSSSRHLKPCMRLSGSKLSARTSSPEALLVTFLKAAVRSRRVGCPESGSDLGSARHLSERRPAHRCGSLSADPHTRLAPVVCLPPLDNSALAEDWRPLLTQQQKSAGEEGGGDGVYYPGPNVTPHQCYSRLLDIIPGIGESCCGADRFV